MVFVCLSIGHVLCSNGWTERDAVRNGDSWGPD